MLFLKPVGQLRHKSVDQQLRTAARPLRPLTMRIGYLCIMLNST